LLDDMDITLQDGDAVSVDLDTPVLDGLQVALDRARPVSVQADGQTRIVRTTHTRPTDVLNAAGVTLSPDDTIVINGIPFALRERALTDWAANINQIQVYRAVDITVIDGDTRRTVRTTGPTVGEALYGAGITVYLADSVVPDASTPVSDDLTVTIQRAVAARVVVDGATIETRTLSPDVAGLLANAGIALLGMDYSIPNEDSPVRRDMTVRVIRVHEAVESTIEPVPFGMIAEADPQLELDQIRLLQPGEPGIRRRDVRVRYENGVPISQEEDLLDFIRTVGLPNLVVTGNALGVLSHTLATVSAMTVRGAPPTAVARTRRGTGAGRRDDQA